MPAARAARLSIHPSAQRPQASSAGWRLQRRLAGWPGDGRHPCAAAAFGRTWSRAHRSAGCRGSDSGVCLSARCAGAQGKRRRPHYSPCPAPTAPSGSTSGSTSGRRYSTSGKRERHRQVIQGGRCREVVTSRCCSAPQPTLPRSADPLPNCRSADAPVELLPELWPPLWGPARPWPWRPRVVAPG